MDGRLCERHVQAAWYDRDIRPAALATRRGSEVRVVHPGDWNLGPGPDFLNAVLEVGTGPDRRRLCGDVEVHLSPLDWDAHGHGDDPAYRRVVAHVTWLGGPEPRTLPPGAVSIWLGRFLAAEPGFSPAGIDLGAYPLARLPAAERPCRERLGGDPDRAGAVLDAEGRRRLAQKARRFGAVDAAGPSASVPRRELFYREVMRALGYSRNAEAFAQVARAVPLGCVEAEPENAAAAFLAAAEFAEWDRANVRPWNSPERRLVAAAAVFTRTDALALAEASDFSRAACRGMVAELTRDHVMGRGRAAAVVTNVVVPLAYAEGRLKEFPDWLPPEDVSEPVRLTACRLLGRDHNPTAAYANNGLRIQGLLQIHRDYCSALHPECRTCGLA